MSIKGLQLEADVENSTKDVLGGGGFQLDTGVYPMVIDMAYMGESRGGATSVNLHLKNAEGGNQVYKHTIYVSSGNNKGNKTYYLGKDGKTKIALPGYTLCDLIAQICAGKALAALEGETKTIKLWDYDAKDEVPTEVTALMELVGKPLRVGMQLVRENKRVQSGNDWVDTNEAREFNEISKVFYPDGRTVAEAAAGDEPLFIKKWTKQNPPDYVRDKFKAVAGAPATAGSDALPGADTPPTEDLFADPPE